MGSNALFAFQFHILHANGIEILPVDSVKPLAADLAKWLEPTKPLEQAPEEISQHTSSVCLLKPKSTELFECYKPSRT